MVRVNIGDRRLQGKDGEYGYAECIAINDYDTITIRFDDTGSIRTNCNKLYFYRGELKDFYKPSVLGVGYLGEAGNKGKLRLWSRDEYYLWYNMLKSCTGDITCSDDFKNFTLFLDWLYSQENYEDIKAISHILGDSRLYTIMMLDSKIYSADTCLLVPVELASLIYSCHDLISKTKKDLTIYDHCIIMRYNYELFNKKVKLRYDVDFWNEDTEADKYRSIARKFCEQSGISCEDKKSSALGAALESYKFVVEAYLHGVVEWFYNFEYDNKKYKLISKECRNMFMNCKIEIIA